MSIEPEDNPVVVPVGIEANGTASAPLPFTYSPGDQKSPEDQKAPGKSLPARALRALERWLAEHTFTPGWLPRYLRYPLLGYLFAILLEVVAIAITGSIVQFFPAFLFSGLLEILVIVIIALTWGVGPSLLATFVGAALLYYVVLPPRFTWVPQNTNDIVEIVLFLLIGFAISIIASQVERARRDAETLAASLASERARFEAVIEADAVFVFDREGRVPEMNRAARELFSFSEGMDFSQALHERGYQSLVLDERGEPLSEDQWPFFRVLRGETITSANAVDILVRKPDGRELELSVSGAPVRDQNGNIVSAVCICRDVTERHQLGRRTQRTLSALLAMAEALVFEPAGSPSGELRLLAGERATHDGIGRVAHRMAELTRSVLDCERVAITMIEQETKELRSLAVVGLSPEQEALWYSRKPGFTLSSLAEQFAQFIQLSPDEARVIDMTQPPFSEMPNPYNIHVMLLTLMSIGDQPVGVLSLDYGDKDHEYTPEEIALARAVGKLTALVIERERLLREREEARASELALREANRRMDEFLGMTTHELKTPLTSIKGNTQLAIRQIQKSLQAFQNMQGMLESTERQVKLLSRLVDDLLDISRVQAGQLDVYKKPCELGSIVREAVEEQRLGWPERTIILNMPEGVAVPVYADPERINQVVTNYLANALKFSGEDKLVQVFLDVGKTEARVSVRDEGVGISPQEQVHVWERFHKVHKDEVQNSAHGATSGLGLGLYICKTIIEQHGGKVGVESAPGAGSTFWFTLPLVQGQESDSSS